MCSYSVPAIGASHPLTTQALTTNGSCTCELGWSGVDCATVEETAPSNLVQFHFTETPSRLCYLDNFTAVVSVTNIPNLTAVRYDVTVVDNQTKAPVHQDVVTTADSFSIKVKLLPVGHYSIVVISTDPLGRGINYAQRHSHEFEVSAIPVVAVSINPVSIGTLKPYETELLAQTSNSKCMPNPIILYSWTLSLAGSNVTLPSSVDTTSAALRIPPGTLTPGSSYAVQVAAQYSNSSHSRSMNSGQIDVGYSLLSGRFTQGRAVTTNLPFTLTAEPSDVDESPDAFTYVWTVTQISNRQAWTNLMSVTSSLHAPASSLPTGEDYYFNCTFSKPGYAPVLISSLVSVVAEQIPQVTIERMASKFLAEDVLELKGNATLGASIYQWSSTPYVNFSKAVDGYSTTTPTLYLESNTLTPGVTYEFTLQAQVSIADPVGIASVLVNVNAAPMAGSFVVSPSTGALVATETEVLFSAANWEDALLDLPLQYQFEIEKDGKTTLLRGFTTAPTYSTSQLSGTVVPVMVVKDAHDTQRRVLFGCSDFKDSAGNWATDAANCPATTIAFTNPTLAANETRNGYAQAKMTTWNAPSHVASETNNFVIAELGLITQPDPATLKLAMQLSSSVIDSVEIGSVVGVISTIVDKTNATLLLSDSALRESFENFVKDSLTAASGAGIDTSDAGTFLQSIVIVQSAQQALNQTISEKLQQVEEYNEEIQLLAKALIKGPNADLNGEKAEIVDGDSSLAVQKMTSQVLATSQLETTGSSVKFSAVPSSSGGRRLLSSDCDSDEYAITLNVVGRNADLHVYLANQYPLSASTGVELYCDDSLQTVENLAPSDEIEVCIVLTQSTNAARCMYFKDGALSGLGVSTTGADSSLAWPLAKTAGETVCCKTNHLSDFVLAEGLYITNFSPARGAVDVDKHTNVTITFNLPIFIGTGDLVFTPSSGHGPNDVKTISLPDARVFVENSSTLVIDFSSMLDDRSDKSWSVTMPAGAVLDAPGGDTHSGFDSTFYNFTLKDTTGPQVLSVTPADQSAYVDIGTQITITFYEVVTRGGNITLTPTYYGSAYWGQYYAGEPRVIEAGDPQVALDDTTPSFGTIVTITPQFELKAGIDWTVSWSTGTFQDTQPIANLAPAFSWTFTTRVVVVSTIPVANSIDNMQSTQIQLTLDGPSRPGVGSAVLRELKTPLAPQLYDYEVTYELWAYHLDRMKQQQLNFDIGSTYTFRQDHTTMAENPLVLLDSNGDVYTTGVTFTLDGMVKTAAQYLAEFHTASSRRLSFTPTKVVPMVYDNYNLLGAGSSIEINHPSSMSIDISSTAIMDGKPEVNFGSNLTMGAVITFVPYVPLAGSTLVQATFATGVMDNFLGPYIFNFTTCECVCRSTSPFQIEAGDEVGYISSGLDRTAGSRLCKWQLTSPPGRVLSLSLSSFDIPSTAVNQSDPHCETDYLELHDGDDQGRMLWRKCGSNFTQDEVFEMSSNQLYLVLSTSGPSNATFMAEYGDSQKSLDLVFSDSNGGGPPLMVGTPLSVRWSTVYALPSTGTSWVGLFKQGECDEDNEWRHQCAIATKTLPASTMDGVVSFDYPEYRDAGYYEVRFFTGANQGRVCNVQNRQFADDDATSYSRCQLVSLATHTVYMAAAGSVPQVHVAGMNEYDTRYSLH